MQITLDADDNLISEKRETLATQAASAEASYEAKLEKYLDGTHMVSVQELLDAARKVAIANRAIFISDAQIAFETAQRRWDGGMTSSEAATKSALLRVARDIQDA